MADTSARTLRLLSLLQARRYWPGDELADQLRVSPRTLRRDVDRLRELGYPIQARRGVAGGYQMAAGTAVPPLVVDDEEAVALAVGLRAAAHSAVEGVAESSVRALAKVVQVMPARLRRRVQALGAMTEPAGWGDAGGSASVDPGVLTTVALACRDCERIRFSYTALGGERTGRYVEPHRLVLLGRRWYLVGYDLGRHGGAASASTGSASRGAPRPGSGPANCPPTTPPPSSGPASRPRSPSTTCGSWSRHRPGTCASGSAGGPRWKTPARAGAWCGPPVTRWTGRSWRWACWTRTSR